MKRTFFLAAVVIGLGLPARGNLLTNGSFEDGNFVPTETGSMLLSAGATDMTGWTVITGGLAWDGPTNPYGLTASDGGYFLDLTGDHDNPPYAGVEQSQTISTIIGAEYQLSFDLGTSSAYDSVPVSIFVSAGTASETFTSGTPDSLNKWEPQTFVFTATSADTSISLTGEASADVKYIGLDNVNIVPVPEPNSLALLAGPGLLVFAAWRRFRKA